MVRKLRHRVARNTVVRASEMVSRKRIRFSLRALLVAVAFAAVLCWWLMIPTYNAKKYVDAINVGDFEVADQMCSDSESRFPAFFFPNGDYETFHYRATIKPVSWQNIWNGTRDITTDFHACSITATRNGIDVEIWLP